MKVMKDMNVEKNKKMSIYVHIPFCKQKCKYCDFISFNSNEETKEKYVNSLLDEINCTKFKGYTVNTIYIGGGTPSYILSENIIKILNEIRLQYIIEDNAEITIEINPGTINKEKLRDYKNAGINRLSIGLQSTNNRLLSLIGRIHTYEEFLETYKLAEEIGFDNINVDLILGLPTQTKDELTQSLDKVIKLSPNHISIYSLILEENTKLKEMVCKKEVELIDDELERDMYWTAKKKLEENQYIHYEISNFAKGGHFSKHNLIYWNQEEYIGFGLNAHSYIDNRRFSNTSDLEKYINNSQDNIEIHEDQTKEEKAKEYMMLGLRKIDGVSISDFENKFRLNPLFYFRFEISDLTEKGLIEVDLDNIKLTNKGLDFANRVFEKFV